MGRTVECAACGRGIVWAITPGGRRIPLIQVQTVYSLGYNPDDESTPRAIKVAFEPGTDQPVYISHFIDCPKANEFSGRSRKKGV